MNINVGKDVAERARQRAAELANDADLPRRRTGRRARERPSRRHRSMLTDASDRLFGECP
jgi:hypothetical protein